MTAEWKDEGSKHHPPSCVLAEKHDYDAGDASLDIERRSDGSYDLVIYRDTRDLSIPCLTGTEVRAVAERILELVLPDVAK